MKRKHDILVYDERERYPHSLYIFAILLSSPFIYLAISRVAMAFLILKGECVYSPLASECPKMPWASVFFDAFSFLHVAYQRITAIKPEINYIQLIMYVMAVLLAILPFVMRNYRAHGREYFLLVFLAAGALCTLLIR